MHDKNLHSNQLRKGYPDPDVPVDEAWASMNTMLDEDSSNAISAKTKDISTIRKIIWGSLGIASISLIGWLLLKRHTSTATAELFSKNKTTSAQNTITHKKNTGNHTATARTFNEAKTTAIQNTINIEKSAQNHKQSNKATSIIAGNNPRYSSSAKEQNSLQDSANQANKSVNNNFTKNTMATMPKVANNKSTDLGISKSNSKKTTAGINIIPSPETVINNYSNKLAVKAHGKIAPTITKKPIYLPTERQYLSGFKKPTHSNQEVLAEPIKINNDSPKNELHKSTLRDNLRDTTAKRTEIFYTKPIAEAKKTLPVTKKQAKNNFSATTLPAQSNIRESSTSTTKTTNAITTHPSNNVTKNEEKSILSENKIPASSQNDSKNSTTPYQANIPPASLSFEKGKPSKDSLKRNISETKKDTTKLKNPLALLDSLKKAEKTTSKPKEKTPFIWQPHAGIRWNFNKPTNNYFTNADGSNNIYKQFLPSFWISNVFGKKQKHELVLSLSFDQQYFVAGTTSDSLGIVLKDSANAIPVNFQTSLSKTSGIFAGLQYNRHLSRRWSIGLGFYYYWQQYALYHKKTTSTTNGTLLAESYRSDRVYQKLLTNKVEVIYHFQKFEIGLYSIFISPLDIFDLTTPNTSPNLQMFFRWRLK